MLCVPETDRLRYSEISSAALQKLIGVHKSVLAELAQRKIIVKGSKRGSYKLQVSVSGYCAHLREQAAGRGGEDAASSRARLASAQAILTETKAKQLSGEVLPTAEVEAFWKASCDSSATASWRSRPVSKT